MTGLQQALVGGWRLESFVSRDDSGVDQYPFGEHPCGLILYTPDGYMSAQLTPGPDGEYIAYAGRFHVDERHATVQHEVMISIMPELLMQPQFRRAHIDDDRLTLSASVTAAEGATTHSTLVWRRATNGAAESHRDDGNQRDS